MNVNLRTILAILLGLLIGGIINMTFVDFGSKIFPVDGVNVDNTDELAPLIPTLGWKFFLFPFLGHALGTLFGAFLAYLIAAQNRMRASMIIGVVFFTGGIMINYILSGNWTFTFLDLIVAYFPMAFLGAKLAQKISPKKELPA